MPKRIPKSERESLWFEFGTDAEFQHFCRTLPSCVSGKSQNVIFAHYRTATNSGTGIKPPFSGVPMTYAEHQHQHQIGQYSFKPREWWEAQVERHLNLWAQYIKNGKELGI